MISLSPTIKGSSGKVADYYLNEEKDISLANEHIVGSLGSKDVSNYYLEQRESSDLASSQWFGRVAQKKGLDGLEVDKATLEKALNGEVAGDKVHGSYSEKRRMGYDLTFSAPKGASIMALSYGDQRVAKAWESSVKFALSEIEKDTAQTRHYDSTTKQSTYENTGNLLFALIKHGTSRGNDPQLHYHALMSNVTVDGSGDLKSLATSIKGGNIEINGTFERIMTNQKYYSSILHSHFGQSLKELGYTIKSVGNGQVDIDGIPQSVLDANSSRSQQIKEYTQELGIDTPKSKDIAARTTRKFKDNVPEATLNEKWRERDKTLGFDGLEFAKSSMSQAHNLGNKSEPRTALESLNNERQSLDKSLDYLSRQSSSFSMQKLVTLSFDKFSSGQPLSIATVRKEIDAMLKTGELLSLNDSNTLFTSAHSIENEKRLINATKARRAGLSVTANETALEQLALSESNKKAIRSILDSRRYTNVVDLKGSQAQISEALLHVADNSKMSVHFVTPHALASKEHAETVSRQSHTLVQWLKNMVKTDSVKSTHQFINQSESLKNGGQLFVVEQANKLGIEQARELIDISRDTKNKIVFLNQSNASKSFSNTDAMALLKNGQIGHFNWESNRVSNSKVTIAATKKGERISALVDDYMRLSKNERQNTAIIAHSKKEVGSINTQIREEMDRLGQLGLSQISFDTVKGVFLDPQERTQSQNYKPGYVISEFRDKQPPIQYEVIRNDKATNRVSVNIDGKVRTFNANDLARKNIGIYQKETMELAAGDRVRAIGTVGNSDIPKFSTMFVSKVSKNGVVLVDEKSNKSYSLGTSDLYHSPLEYNYASTLNKLESGKNRVFVSSNNYSESRERVEDIVNKASESIKFFTEDPKKLEKQIDKSSIQPSSIQRAIASSSVTEKYLGPDTAPSLSKDISLAMRELTQKQNLPLVERTVSHAISLLSEREAAFSHKDLVKTAIKHALDEHGTPLSLSDIESTMAKLEQKGKLLSTQYSDDIRWVTQSSLATERDILNRIEQGKGSVEPLASVVHVKSSFEDSRTTIGQKDAITLIATTEDKFTAVQGFAGTGKSTMLETGIDIVQLFESNRHLSNTQFIGAAPTHSAVLELKEKGVPAVTVQKLLHDFSANGPNPNHNKAVFLLDESSMASNSQMAEFVKMVDDTEGARAVWLGDAKQIQAISAGKPFQLAIERDLIATAYMKDIVRQDSEPLLNAVQKLIDRDGFGALDELKSQPNLSDDQYTRERPSLFKSEILIDESNFDKSVISDENPYQAAAIEYLSRTKASRDNTIVIMYSNAERDQFVEMIRPQLKEFGEINNTEAQFSRLRTKGTDPTQMAAVSSYRTGDVYSVVDNYFTITDVNKEARTVTLQDQNGGTRVMLPEFEDHKYAQVWEKADKPLSIGESIVWRKTDKDLGIMGNEQMLVTNIDNGQLSVISQASGKKFELDNSALRNQHWDYAYTRTANLAQGSTFKNGISVIDSTAKLTDIRRAYIDVSRAVENMKVFTNDEKGMLGKWLSTDAEKLSAIDIVEKTAPAQDKHFEESYKSDPRFMHEGEFKLSLYGKHIANELSQYTESLVRNELGRENQSQSSKDYLVYGDKNQPQLRVSLTSEYRGFYRNFASGERGNMLNFLMDHKEIGYVEAVKLGSKMVSSPEEFGLEANHKHGELVQSIPNEQQRYIEFAHRYSEESKNVAGTLAERFIEKMGGEMSSLNHSSVRFHPAVYSSESQSSYPAMITRLENTKGHLTGIEISYLDENGKLNESLDINQRTLGVKSGSIATLSSSENSKGTLIAVNTGLALELSRHYPDLDIKTVPSNSDLRNIASTNMSNPIILLNNMESPPSTGLIMEIERNFGPDSTIINTQEKSTSEVSQLIDSAVSRDFESIDSLVEGKETPVLDENERQTSLIDKDLLPDHLNLEEAVKLDKEMVNDNYKLEEHDIDRDIDLEHKAIVDDKDITEKETIRYEDDLSL